MPTTHQVDDRLLADARQALRDAAELIRDGWTTNAYRTGTLHGARYCAAGAVNKAVLGHAGPLNHEYAVRLAGERGVTLLHAIKRALSVHIRQKHYGAHSDRLPQPSARDAGLRHKFFQGQDFQYAGWTVNVVGTNYLDQWIVSFNDERAASAEQVIAVLTGVPDHVLVDALCEEFGDGDPAEPERPVEPAVGLDAAALAVSLLKPEPLAPLTPFTSWPQKTVAELYFTSIEPHPFSVASDPPGPLIHKGHKELVGV